MRGRMRLVVGAVLAGGLLALGIANARQVGEAQQPLPDAMEPGVISLANDRGIDLLEAQERMSWQSRAPDLAARLRSELGPTWFGGIWIGRDDDRVKIGVVSGRADGAAVVWREAARLGLDGATDVFAVRHSEAAIEASREWLSAQVAETNREAGWPLELGVRISANAVELRLPEQGTLTAAQQALVAEATARFGSMVQLGRYSGSGRAEFLAGTSEGGRATPGRVGQ